jgi:molybdopterin/thiamine biosynthesis adenylyltransferase
MKINLYIIGLGGIGSNLCEPICKFLNYTDYAEDYSLIFIDGDSYEEGNKTRQYFEDENKNINKAFASAKTMHFRYNQLKIKHEDIYINSQNIESVIDKSTPAIILSGVDNHKTRKLIQDHCNEMDNVLCISGGNDYYDGDIFVFAKKNNIQLAPTIYQNNPAIKNPKDRHPDEIGCEELVQSEPQLLFTNGTASIIMQWCFYNYHRLFHNNDVIIHKNDIKFDIQEMAVLSHNRPTKKEN